jgi:hypothetical protein
MPTSHRYMTIGSAWPSSANLVAPGDRGGPAQPGGLGVPLEAWAPTMGPYDQPK